jgi:hypothetical protein
MSAEMEVHNGEPIRGELVVGELANERTDGWIRVLQPVAELASQVAGTEFVPVAIRQKPAAITAAILFGRELDMPPMQALSQVHVVEGRPSLSAEHMRAMVLAAGHEISYDLMSPGQVTATGRRWYGGTRGWGAPTSVTWSIPMAERAGLLGKNNWKKHPRQMLEARATAELCRLIFADITHGLPSVEEMEDGGLYDESPAEPGPAPSSGSSPVSRRTRKGTSKSAGGPATETPPVAPESVPPAPRPPLPGVQSQKAAGSSPATGEPAAAGPAGDSTPGEGRASTSSTPAGPPAEPLDRAAEGATVEPEQCPATSHGHRCRYYEGHEGKHTFGGGMGDPVTPKRCRIQLEHDSHAWNEKGDEWHTCSGDPLEVMSEGDGSADDVGATGTDEQYAEMKAAAEDVIDAEVVDEVPEGIHPGQKRALEAAFNSLGIKDRAQIHHAASALLGRQVTTFKPKPDDPGGLTAYDGSRLLNALAKVNSVDELEALIQRAAEAWGGGTSA